MIELYGIANCDTIRKARKWLNEAGIEYTFHDFKKTGIDPAALDEWIEHLGWEILLNRRGTTWRKLPEETRNTIDQASARKVMLEQPSIIKRPVLNIDGRLTVGFSDDQYNKLFS